MKSSIVFLIAIAFLPLLNGCSKQPMERHHTILAFGTLIEVTLYNVEQQIADQAFDELDNNFKMFHEMWSPWQAGSLMRINTLLPTGKRFSAGPSVIPLIQQSIKLADDTNHLYNPAIGQLINLWQFHKNSEPDIQPPAAEKIASLVTQNPRMTNLHLDGVQLSSDNPAVQLNFGAFAKGYAIDLSMDYLKSLGIKNAIINTGGDLKAIGSHGQRPWRIAIRHPRNSSVLASIETDGEESVFTSGDYERFYFYNNKRYHHILDPRTGYPATESQSVTVIHNQSGLADAAATALFIAGPDEWYGIAKKLGLKQVMLIDKQGKIHVTPAMKQRLIFNAKIEATLIVSPAL
ncbi:MAG: FAD:protein FMN transferase [Gammaproteobacteria bacterium]|nr:FAD:protein FMN transferase [Gammaproteobacteria bacterium]